MKCTGKRNNLPCEEIVDPQTEWGSLGVCSRLCYSFQFMSPGEEPIEQGSRYNEGKARFDLIPAVVMTKLAEHYTYGAGKYSPNNWVKGFPYSQCSASLLRHLYAWLGGEDIDPESKAHHLVAVIWNAVTLMYFELFPKLYHRFDDRLGPTLKRDEADEMLDEANEMIKRHGGTWVMGVPVATGPCPIPDGYRILSAHELVQPHDMVRQLPTNTWDKCGKIPELVGEQSGRYTFSIIRKLETAESTRVKTDLTGEQK